MNINTGEPTKDTEINNEVADGNDNYVPTFNAVGVSCFRTGWYRRCGAEFRERRTGRAVVGGCDGWRLRSGRLRRGRNVRRPLRRHLQVR